MNTEDFRTFFEVYSTTQRIFFSKDGRNHKKMYIFLKAKTFINFETAETAMKREKRYFITNSPKLKGCAIQFACYITTRRKLNCSLAVYSVPQPVGFR